MPKGRGISPDALMNEPRTGLFSVLYHIDSSLLFSGEQAEKIALNAISREIARLCNELPERIPIIGLMERKGNEFDETYFQEVFLALKLPTAANIGDYVSADSFGPLVGICRVGNASFEPFSHTLKNGAKVFVMRRFA